MNIANLPSTAPSPGILTPTITALISVVIVVVVVAVVLAVMLTFMVYKNKFKGESYFLLWQTHADRNAIILFNNSSYTTIYWHTFCYYAGACSIGVTLTQLLLFSNQLIHTS